jgi:FlaA1/EpsC-like NDP-sugar epimerase
LFHAAAHKHLPLLERYPAEGVKTNVFGTLNLVKAASESGVGRFVNISTDKAARPTSILGATKRWAELVVAAHAGPDMRVASVRFGNVLGSRGSFLHGLAAQVDRGQQITITDPQVTRFFMTIPEAAGLVIEAAVMARAGETYVLDMGDPVRIIDLVLKYLALTGLSAPGISFTGLRPGEKLHESLFDSAELGQATRHPKISAVSQRRDVTEVTMARLPALRKAVAAGDIEELRRQIMTLLPDERVQPMAAPSRQLTLA